MKDLFEDGFGGTWIELLIVKYTLEAVERMKKEGDFVLEIVKR